MCLHLSLSLSPYIYILDSHMAPYGAGEVAQSTARSNAQFEAERFRKGCRSQNKHGRKCFRRKKKQARTCFRSKKEACSSSDFERSVASKHFRAENSSAQRLRSTFEQRFRALSRRSCACAVFSSAVKLVSRLTFSRPTGDLSGEPIFLYIKYFVLFSSR